VLFDNAINGESLALLESLDQSLGLAVVVPGALGGVRDLTLVHHASLAVDLAVCRRHGVQAKHS